MSIPMYVCLSVFNLNSFFARPLIGPQITWSDPIFFVCSCFHATFPKLYWSYYPPPNPPFQPPFLTLFSRNLSKIVAVLDLLSASVKRVGVSHMRDFFKNHHHWDHFIIRSVRFAVTIFGSLLTVKVDRFSLRGAVCACVLACPGAQANWCVPQLACLVCTVQCTVYSAHCTVNSVQFTVSPN